MEQHCKIRHLCVRRVAAVSMQACQRSFVFPLYTGARPLPGSANILQTVASSLETFVNIVKSSDGGGGRMPAAWSFLSQSAFVMSCFERRCGFVVVVLFFGVFWMLLI